MKEYSVIKLFTVIYNSESLSDSVYKSNITEEFSKWQLMTRHTPTASYYS